MDLCTSLLPFRSVFSDLVPLVYIDHICTQKEEEWLAFIKRSKRNIWDFFWFQGCFKSIENFLENNLLYVGITGIIFAIFQVSFLDFSFTVLTPLISFKYVDFFLFCVQRWDFWLEQSYPLNRK